ncbi:hypothetical protein BH11ARM2_BH11ARM2_29700 [soil metagenome]
MSLLLLSALLMSPPPSLSVPQAATPPALGKEDGWAGAAVIPSLSVSLGEDGRGLVPKPTEVRLLWDEHALYVRFSCADDDVYLPVQGRDAPLYQGDVAEIFLDPVGDGRQYFEIQSNAAGDLFDQLITVTAPKMEHRPDGRLADRIVARDFWPVPEWNMEGIRWTGRQASDGWTVDFAIPAPAALHRMGRDRFVAGDVFRAHLMRYDYLPGNPRRLLAMNWAPVQYGCPHISPSAMGTLRLVK